jgi:hypothetical protein
MTLGEPAAAREHCDAGGRLYDPERHRLHRQLYGGHDPGCARMVSVQVHWLPLLTSAPPNLDILGVYPAKLDAMVLSHGHYDHFGRKLLCMGLFSKN